MRPERCEQERRVDVAFTPRSPQRSSTVLHPRSVPGRAAVPRNATRQHMCLHGGLAAGLLPWFSLDRLLNVLRLADSKIGIFCINFQCTYKSCCGFHDKFSRHYLNPFHKILFIKYASKSVIIL